MSISSIEEDRYVDLTPPDIMSVARNASDSLLPPKSRDKYMAVYETFIQWKIGKNENFKMRWFWAVLCCSISAQDYAKNESVKLLRQYLQINTTTRSNLDKAVEFWQAQANKVHVRLEKFEFYEGFPVLVIKWPGKDPTVGSIMLNSHMDVAPAKEKGWTYPPFSGALDKKGMIWGRGVQDMKSVSIQYFEALKRIKAKGFVLLRNVYMTLMPGMCVTFEQQDQESGGYQGMVPFLASDYFKEMNIAFELDEGTPSGDLPFAAVFYQDKVPWRIKVECHGEKARGSSFPENPASVQCAKVIQKFMQFREQEVMKYMALGGALNAAVYTVVNLNVLRGGSAKNIIPDHVSLIFDMRLATSIDEDAFDAQLNKWISESGPNVTLKYLQKGPQSPATLISKDNPFWAAFTATAFKRRLIVLPAVPTRATDARFVRDAGIPALGFSPMPNTENLVHSVNECLHASTFLKGIDIYTSLIGHLASVAGGDTSSDPSIYIVKTTPYKNISRKCQQLA